MSVMSEMLIPAERHVLLLLNPGMKKRDKFKFSLPE